ncbi:MAG: hypothetical protein V2J07_02055 [Anaerolineae bacterium]|jgi:hypothetical protein|nr:hypothetical protein [Anaerolineae bacterium]
MSLEEKVSITISIAKSYRDRLRAIAAKRNLHDLDQLTSASTIAREIVCDHIDELERVEIDFQAAGTELSRLQESEHEGR